MSKELLKEPDGSVVADFHVKLPSDVEQPTGAPGKSLIREVELLRQQVSQLCQAVRGLVQLQSVLNQGVQQLLKRDGVIGVDCAVL
jgi:hypothetical protein